MSISTTSEVTTADVDEPSRKRPLEEGEVDESAEVARKKQRLDDPPDVEMREPKEGPDQEPGELVMPSCSPPKNPLEDIPAENAGDADADALQQHAPPPSSPPMTGVTENMEGNESSAPDAPLQAPSAPEEAGEIIAESSTARDPACAPETLELPPPLTTGLRDLSLSASSSDVPMPSEPLPSPPFAPSPPTTTASLLGTTPPQLGSSTTIEVRVKQEVSDPVRPPSPSSTRSTTESSGVTPAELAKFSIRHLDLAYNKSKGKMVCRMCILRKTKDKMWKVSAFPEVASTWTQLRDHCADAHPAGFLRLVELSPAKAAEMRERMEKQ
ncbi:hypothetical protein NM688_g4261 [Phlebia brevispora]|uniref:Uncharacterized protein n=1 Tax=Phlebia brevispora TaxID=194682 RepID=A0ACC1T3L3_9APHY|nr:hypothetical protein NM688_g4261 [Phlebia brevispora]